jgi:hypothetical protein
LSERYQDRVTWPLPKRARGECDWFVPPLNDPPPPPLAAAPVGGHVRDLALDEFDGALAIEREVHRLPDRPV